MIKSGGDRGSRGATIVMVALLMVPLLGIMSIVVDLGRLYQERRELQNGADAAALAVAADCARGACGAMATTANTFADGNALDSASTIDAVNKPSTVVGSGANSVEVVVSTDGSAGNQVSFYFARIFGLTGRTVRAKATASWSSPGTATTIPLIFSSCEWSNATANGATFPTGYRIIYFHDVNSNGANSNPPPGGWCSFGPGQDIDGNGTRNEGGFGFLAGTGCSVTINAGGWVAEKPGNGTPSLDCNLADLRNKEILIPIFDDISTTGATCGAANGKSCYHVYGFAAMLVLDVDFNGALANQGDICAPNRRCIGGNFIRFVTLQEGLNAGSGQPNLGVSVVKLTG